MLASIVLVIFILLLIYFFIYPKFLKGKKDSQDKQKVDTSEVFGPQIEFGPSEAVYTPYSEISNYEIEGYSIEYDEGVIPYANLSNAVELIFNWRNRFGFINVTGLKFDWYAGTTTDNDGKTIDALIGSKEYNVASATGDPKDYFKTNYPPTVNEDEVQKYNSVSFKLPKDNTTVSVMGDNYVIMSYKLKDSTGYTPIFSKQDLIDINTIINISEKDLSQTLELKDTINQTYTPGIAKSGDDAMKVTSSIDKTGYYIIPGAENIENIGNETIQYLIDQKDNGRIIMNPGKDNYNVKLMVEDTGYYIKYSFSNPDREFSFVDTYADATDFTIVEGEKENTVRFRLQNDNTDYFMTYTSISGKGRVLVMKSYDEVENDEYYGYDLSFLETSGNQDCVFQWEVTDPTDETYLTTGIRKKTFRVTRPQSGNGKACLDTDGSELTYTDGDIVDRNENLDCKLNRSYDWQGCSVTCGGGIDKAPMTIEQAPFNEGKSCDVAKSGISIGTGEVIKGDINQGYWVEKACMTQSCESCKVRPSWVTSMLDWMPNWVGVGDSAQVVCSTLTNKDKCDAGSVDKDIYGEVHQQFGYAGHWKNICEWK
jgi:hypothetical protein